MKTDKSANKKFQGLTGQIIKNAPIGAQSWFRCGGNADLLFKPADEEGLAAFLQQWPDDEPLTVIGGLANTIIRDGGIRGATIQFGKSFADIQVMSDTYIHAGCGALNGSIAAAAVKVGIGGLEFLSGIPGSFGGALRMNAGAYGTEIADIFVGANAMTRTGKTVKLTPEDMHYTYRHCGAPSALIFTSAILKGVAEDYETVKTRMNDIKARRNETQPIKEQTGGSTFANPDGTDLRAWEVVDKIGGRGFRIGGAQMSEKHCNFMINTGNATASDLENLGDHLRQKALHELGIELRWEIKRIGEKA